MSPTPDDHPVRRARVAKRLRLRDVAERAECSVPTLSNIEHGYVPPVETMERVAKALERHPYEFWPDEFEAPDDPDTPPPAPWA